MCNIYVFKKKVIIMDDIVFGVLYVNWCVILMIVILLVQLEVVVGNIDRIFFKDEDFRLYKR